MQNYIRIRNFIFIYNYGFTRTLSRNLASNTPALIVEPLPANIINITNIMYMADTNGTLSKFYEENGGDLLNLNGSFNFVWKVNLGIIPMRTKVEGNGFYFIQNSGATGFFRITVQGFYSSI